MGTRSGFPRVRQPLGGNPRPVVQRFGRVIHRPIVAGVVALLALNTFVFLAGAWVLTRFPFELDYGEGIVLWQADRVLHLAEAYHPIHVYPYTVFHYPPLYHLLTRLARTAVHDPLIAGRMVAWLSALGVALCVGLIVKLGTGDGLRRSGLAGLIASLLVFHVPNIGWVPYMRVDVTALCLSLLGLFLFLRWPSALGAALAGVVFVAALFTKQSMIAGPTAAFAALLLAGRRRDATVMLVVIGALGGGLVSVLALATEGEFLRHTLAYNLNPFDAAQLVTSMIANLIGMNALAGLALALPIVTLAHLSRGRDVMYRRAWSTERGILLTAILYFAAAFVVSLSAGKLGAWKNYFLEWNVACCILTGLLAGRVLKQSRRLPRSPTALAIILILGIIAFSRIGATARQWNIVAGRDPEFHQLAADAGRALDFIQATRGSVFSDDMTLLHKAGQDVPWEPAIATVLASAGVWDERLAIELINATKFEAIVVRYLNEPLFFSPAIRAAVHDAYADAGAPAGPYRILRPRATEGRWRDSAQPPSR